MQGYCVTGIKYLGVYVQSMTMSGQHFSHTGTLGNYVSYSIGIFVSNHYIGCYVDVVCTIQERFISTLFYVSKLRFPLMWLIIYAVMEQEFNPYLLVAVDLSSNLTWWELYTNHMM